MDASNPQHVAIAEFLNQKAQGDQRVAKLLWHCVGRVWLKADGYFLSHDIARIGMITHIADWLKVSVLENAPWLAKVDDQGRPKKLLKFGTLEAIHAEADRQMRRKQARQAAAELLLEDDEVLHYDLGGGWRIVRMLSERALDRESELMQHCIGHGGYDEDLAGDGTLLLSLRDPRGKPHATIEIEDGELIQFQGKQNRVPIEKYIDRCLPFLNSSGVNCNGSGILVTDVSGAVYSIHDLPEALSVKSDLMIRSDPQRAVRLPRRITVGGDLTIAVIANSPGFFNVPEVLEVGRDLTISGSGFKELPQSTKVGGSIRLDYSGISQLPPNLSVAGNFSLRMTPIRVLPPGLRVANNLDLYKTELVEIPEDLRCGSINIGETKIRRFDTSVFIDDEATGDSRSLLAAESLLEEIVGVPTFSRLDVSRTLMSVLPEGLVAAGNLNISTTSIRDIPANVKIGHSLAATYCDIDIALSEVGGNADFANSKVSLPPAFACGGMLKLSGAEVRQMPRHVKAMTFRMSRGTADKLPEHVEAELVDVSGIQECRLTGTIHTVKLRISGDVKIIGTGVRASEVEVLVNRNLYCAPLKDVREHLERLGNLNEPPKNAMVVPFMTFGLGSGKTTFMSRMLREMAGGRLGLGVVAYGEPVPFVFDHEMPNPDLWRAIC